MIVPQATIDIHKLEEELKTGEDPVRVQVSADPSQAVKILYEKWWKQQARIVNQGVPMGKLAVVA
jgi:hypothetical protein